MALRVPPHAHDADDSVEYADQGERTTPVAFEDLWRHRFAVRDICQRIVGDTATADDMVQETYLRAFRNLDSLERRPSLMPWLATVARRRSIDELRRRGYQQPVEEMPDEGTTPEYDPGETAVVNETVSQVRDALTSLTDRERELLVGQVNQGMTLAELADREHTSVASVRSVLSRARMKLREALVDAGSRVAAPIGLAGHWIRRKLAEVNARVQRVAPTVPGGYERLGEAATATVTAAALTVGGVLVPAANGHQDADGDPEAALVSGAAVVSTHRAFDLRGLGDADIVSTEPESPVAADDVGEPDRHHDVERPGDDVGPVSGGTLDEATADIPEPSPPPERGEPTPPPSPPPEEPEDAEIVDLDMATASGSGSAFAMGAYYGGCGAGACPALFRSDDGGASWDVLSATDLSADTILVPPGFDGSSENRLYAMGEKGLQRSTNGGASFHTVLGQPTYSGPAAISPGFNEGHDKIFVGSAPFWSYDAGDDKVRPLGLTGISGSAANFAFAPDYLDTGVLYAGSSTVTETGTVPAVYVCDSGPCEATPVPELMELPEVVAYDDGADRVVVAYSETAMVVSVGDTLDFGPAIDLALGGEIADVASNGVGDLYVTFASTEPDDPNGGVAVTGDGGATWQALSAGTPLARGVNAVATDGDVAIVALSDAAGYGVTCSDSGGTAWSRRCRP